MKNKKTVTTIFLLIFFSGFVFGQQDEVQFITSDENFQSGLMTEIHLEGDCYYRFIVKAKGNDEVFIFYCKLMKQEPIFYLCVYNDKNEFIAQVMQNKNSANGGIDVYDVNEAEQTIEKIGSAYPKEFNIKVYDTSDELVAILWKYIAAVQYYVEFKSDKIRREAILSVIPMVKRD